MTEILKQDEFVDGFGTIHRVNDPDPFTISIEAIARGLSRICRFNGHCKRYYSVAQHSIHVSRLVAGKTAEATRSLQLWGLLHDASEAYIGDLIRPVKVALGPKIASLNVAELNPYKRLEHRWMVAIGVALDFPLHLPEPASVKMADRISLATEYRDNMPWNGDAPHNPDSVPVDVRRLQVYRFAPAWRAERAFLRRYRELTR